MWIVGKDLSWRKVIQLFKLLYRFMEIMKDRRYDQFSLFEKTWYTFLDNVVPWIQDNGGWVSHTCI